MSKATTELGDTPRARDPVQVRGLSEMAATGVVGRVAATAITAEENADLISRPVSTCSSEWVLEDPAEARQAFWNRDRRQGNEEGQATVCSTHVRAPLALGCYRPLVG
ncbi:hypothetical protein [Rhodococcus koreensis]|uniref:hypothetical protein n=1 Tax=Rhodococcus koreensis TaxID=99653 RepID=UPI003670E4EC